jgi:hypothetical protein
MAAYLMQTGSYVTFGDDFAGAVPEISSVMQKAKEQHAVCWGFRAASSRCARHPIEAIHC